MEEVQVETTDNTAFLPEDGDDECAGPSNPFGPNTGGDEGHEHIGMTDIGDKSLDWDATPHNVTTSTRRGSAEGDDMLKELQRWMKD